MKPMTGSTFTASLQPSKTSSTDLGVSQPHALHRLGGTRRDARGLHPVYRTDLHADQELREQSSRSGARGDGTAGAGAAAGDGGRRRRDRRGSGRPRHHRHRSRSRRHRDLPGSSANNAISKSGVKEKKLTLDFCLILRDELLRQASSAGETINVVLTRTTDVNLAGESRARMAFTNRAKLFLCLHFNGSSNASTRERKPFFARPRIPISTSRTTLLSPPTFTRRCLAHSRRWTRAPEDRGVKPDTKWDLAASAS